MLAFIDSPIQLMVVLVVLLILFGPQKLPEIGQQLGRALRELKRTTSEFTNALHLDDPYDTTYTPPRYGDYGHSSTVEEDAWRSETQAQAALSAPETPRGDFAAAALADASADYGVGLGPSASEAGSTSHSTPVSPRETSPRPAEGTVPRSP
jgi:TatA/E family protein of Tat protein translocase